MRTLYIYMNLRSLHWIKESTLDFVMGVVFMHERVRKLVVWIPFDNPDEPEMAGGDDAEVQDVRHFMEVSTPMSRLTELDLPRPSSCTQGTGCISDIQSLSLTFGTGLFPALSEQPPYKTCSASSSSPAR